MNTHHSGDRNNQQEVKQRLQTQYADAVAKDDSPHTDDTGLHDALAYAVAVGYSVQEMKSVPENAAVTHGCGNPTALAALREGETVVDLGCGGGLDAFLAAQRVGHNGKVIGIDMTPEMVEKARANAEAGNYGNVEFMRAEIETLPLPDESADVIISNCVINHAVDKLSVFREAFRVLKPDGRIFVSDLVTVGRLPDAVIRNADKLWAQWLAVASDKTEYLDAFMQAGFQKIVVVAEGVFPLSEADNMLKGRIISIQLCGAK